MNGPEENGPEENPEGGDVLGHPPAEERATPGGGKEERPEGYTGEFPPPRIPPYQMDPAVHNRALEIMQKTLKGGSGRAVLGGVLGGMLYIMLPLLPYLLLKMLAPPIVWEEMPEQITEFFTTLLAIALFVGWAMVILGAVKGYHMRGTTPRLAASLASLGVKAILLYALFYPFIITLDMGNDSGSGGFSIDMTTYVNILYTLILVRAAYFFLEYWVYRDDVSAWNRGEIPDYYYRKAYKKVYGRKVEEDFGENRGDRDILGGSVEY
ncbi:MAG: hypothetical protein J7L61_03780, partial [Thermoplasmata archaeon]|nr:hypothetical protein [Thermoplasmata archaeon]